MFWLSASPRPSGVPPLPPPHGRKTQVADRYRKLSMHRSTYLVHSPTGAWERCASRVDRLCAALFRCGLSLLLPCFLFFFLSYSLFCPYVYHARLAFHRSPPTGPQTQIADPYRVIDTSVCVSDVFVPARMASDGALVWTGIWCVLSFSSGLPLVLSFFPSPTSRLTASPFSLGTTQIADPYRVIDTLIRIRSAQLDLARERWSVGVDMLRLAPIPILLTFSFVLLIVYPTARPSILARLSSLIRLETLDTPIIRSHSWSNVFRRAVECPGGRTTG